MFQLTQPKSQHLENYMPSNASSHLNIRQFGRRLSHHFTKVISKWKSTGMLMEKHNLVSLANIILLIFRSK